MKLKITIGEEILDVCPSFHLVAIICKVKNTKYNDELWREIDKFIEHFPSSSSMTDIKKRPAIEATRKVYKQLGKDPNRYRPSGEALCRRILKGQGLYQIDTLVDLINLISLKTGYSIGGFDADKIEGNLRLGVGIADEPFEAIGRGKMNIEGLPVYRDSIGGIGNPSSDEERTKISLETVHLLMLINGYSGKEGLNEATDYSIDLLKKYAYADQIKIRSVNGEISKSN
ncbi:MAG: phenylalanine--tRNA ligase beta subunit-related protein [Fermentimonas sp.]|jgi:DNA/RNA-binding domain of Phe-tRNA-synthetase-like protein|nr:phenylalanine--tRNA ligase beta subunit-related protein [Fermentimonas sp.]MDD3510723.1 phenylalanine--tRNA ligase beta subunit-related protein [Fermentimonas sp.]